MSWSMLLTIFVSIIRLSIPIVLTALGNMFCLQAGIMNLGADGMMISGAFGAAVTSYLTGNPWLGVLVGMLCGAVIGMVHSLISVEFGGMQNISGLGLNMLAAGLTSFFCRSMFHTALTPNVASIQSMPWLSGIPVIGPVLSQFSPILLLLIAVFLLCCYIMNRSVAGLRIVAVGSDPQTVETAGINVWRLKHICVVCCGALAGLAGAYLSVGQLNIFMENMTNGKGMLAVIAVTIGRRRPMRTVIVALLFGVFDALQLQIQISSGSTNIPPELIQIIPYAAAILAMVFASGKNLDNVNMKPYLKNRYKF